MNRLQIIEVRGVGARLLTAIAVFTLIWFETFPIVAAIPSPAVAKAKHPEILLLHVGPDLL
jgi:hypothetical protein